MHRSGTLIASLVGVAAAVVLMATGPALAESRIALVIGNGAYTRGMSPLTNPPNDAKLMSDALETAGFQVKTVIDADQKAMKKAFAQFGQDLAEAGSDAVGLFYYAGHGVQVGGTNYLIPTGADIERAADVDMEAVDTDWVLQQMEFAGNRMNIIILDACRNNPLPGENRSAEQGLARMDAPTGSFIAYSTAPGQVAADGKGGNSPYSKALADAIKNQRVPLEQLFRQVRVSVMEQTDKKQVPWDSSSLTGEFFFKTPDGSAPQQVASVAPAPTSDAGPGEEDSASRGQSAALPAAPGKPFRDCEDCPEMVVVPAGNFTMGSPEGDDANRPDERPQVKVKIPAPFALMTTEVTRDQFAAFLSETGRKTRKGCYIPDGGEGKWSEDADLMDPGIPQDGDHPAVCVNWSEARAYAQWLSEKTGKHYRLPTEAEFEYASRAGKKSPWQWGEDPYASAGCKQANIFDKDGKAQYPINEEMIRCSDGFAATGPVDALEANAFGLKGMVGNVWEWLQDCYHDSYKGAPDDGSAWEDGDCGERVVRGSSYMENVWDGRFASRYKIEPIGSETNVGFRLARDID